MESKDALRHGTHRALPLGARNVYGSESAQIGGSKPDPLQVLLHLVILGNTTVVSSAAYLLQDCCIRLQAIQRGNGRLVILLLIVSQSHAQPTIPVTAM
jgi:hypothetical protein